MMPTSSDLATAPAFPDLTDPQTFLPGVPHAAFERMRALPGMYWQPTEKSTVNGGFWAVTRWDDIVAVEKDPATFSSARGGAYPMIALPVGYQSSLMASDPPRHSQLRRAAAKGFGPRVVAHFEPWVRGIVTEVLDRLETLDDFDYVMEVCRTIPARVVARVLGCRPEDEDDMVRWAYAMFAAFQPGAAGSALTAMKQVNQEIFAYAEMIQAIKRREPAEDMFTVIGQCVERGEMTQEDFLSWMMLMIVAGFETTHTALGQSMRMYLEDPDVRDKTDRAIDEGRTDRVVDEFLRLVSPPMEMARMATCDTELGGEKIAKDDVMVLYFTSANRDGAKFTDPDTFDPWRQEVDTLAFGSGVHRCIGSYLAKLEIGVLWEELHRRGINLELNGEAKRGWSVFINQISELPVRRVGQPSSS
jgi:cytochrome P450